MSINPSPGKIHGHSKVSKLQTRKRTAELQGDRGNLGHTRGIMDLGTAEKLIHKQNERSLEIDGHSFIPPVNVHRLQRTGEVSASTWRECPWCKSDPDRDAKLGTPPCSPPWLRFGRQTESSSISPRCGPLLRQEWVEKQGEEEEEEVRELAMTPSRQGWWSWNENTSVGQEQSEKRETEGGKRKMERQKSSPTLLHSSLAGSGW